MDLLQLIIALAGFFMQVLVLHAMIRGPYREFRLLFVLCTLNLLETVVLSAALFGVWHWTPESARLYWITSGFMKVVIFLTLLTFFWSASEGRPNRARWLSRVVVLGSLSLIAAALLGYDARLGFWLGKASRNLNFVSMLLSFGLWTMLLRRPDKRLLLLCAGFGIYLSGAAIGDSLRDISRQSVYLGNLILTLSYVVGQYIWWRALYRQEPVNASNAVGQDSWPAGVKDLGVNDPS